MPTVDVGAAPPDVDPFLLEGFFHILENQFFSLPGTPVAG